MPAKHKCQAMRMANDAFIRKFCSHVKKLRHANVHPAQVKVLSANRAALRKLANSKVSLKSKRKMLSQRGGFVSALIPLIASIAGPAIKGIVQVVKRHM